MPSVSRAQRVAMAIAEHSPGRLYARNRGLLKMSHSQLHDFASTKETGLPEHVRSAGHPGRNLGAHLHPKKGARLGSRLRGLRMRGRFTKY